MVAKTPWLPVIILALGFYIYTFDAKIHFGGDNAEYYQLGQGFTLNKGYVNAMLVGEPQAVHYPPGYPFILSIPMRMGITDIYWLKWLNGLFFFGSIILLFKFVFALDKNWWLASIVTLFVATNAQILNYSFILMSEVPYTFTALMSLFAVFNYQNGEFENQDIKKYSWLFIALIFAVISYYIRSIGIVIPIALVLFFAWKKNFKALLINLVGSTVLITPWMLRMNALGGGGYQGQLMKINPYRPELGNMETLNDWFNRFSANLIRYTSKEIESAIFNFLDWGPKVESLWWMYALGIGLLILGIIGLYTLDKKIRAFIVLFILGHFGVLMLWPEVWYGPRFMLSTVPVLVYLLAKSILYLLKAYKESVAFKYLGVGLLVIILIVQIKPLERVRAYSQGGYNPSYKEYFDLAAAVKAQYSEEMVISCRKPAFFYLLSGKKVNSYLFTSDHDELIEDLKEKKVTHVVLDNLGFSSTARYLLPAIQNRPEHFQLVARREGANTYLFKLNY